MRFIDKFRIWLQTTGFKNLGLIILVILSLFMFKSFWSGFWTGVFLGIFIYINFNIIQKLIRNAFNKIDR